MLADSESDPELARNASRQKRVSCSFLPRSKFACGIFTHAPAKLNSKLRHASTARVLRVAGTADAPDLNSGLGYFQPHPIIFD